MKTNPNLKPMSYLFQISFEPSAVSDTACHTIKGRIEDCVKQIEEQLQVGNAAGAWLAYGLWLEGGIFINPDQSFKEAVTQAFHELSDPNISWDDAMKEAADRSMITDLATALGIATA